MNQTQRSLSVSKLDTARRLGGLTVTARNFCLNRRRMARRSRLPFFEVRASAIQGLGAFALRKIRKGTRIIEYQGERIDADEADRRYADDDRAEAHVLLFTVDKHTFIDAGVNGNAARFINHSCAPNCEAVNEAGQIYIEALRTIAPGEELTYDYRLEYPQPFDPEWAQRYTCRCGAANCRGTLLARRPKPRTKVRPYAPSPS
jgi:SET domain-containing protein